MEGRRIEDVLVARRDLRWPLPDDFEAHLKGRTITREPRRSRTSTSAPACEATCTGALNAGA